MADARPASPQLTTLIFRDVFDRMDAPYKDWLVTTMGTHVFQEFCLRQMEASKTALAEVGPEQFSSEDYIKISSDMRLRYRFWTDLKRLADDLTNSRANRSQL